MKKPTLEEVKEYFKDALEVRCQGDPELKMEITNIDKDGCFYYTGEKPNDFGSNRNYYAVLWNRHDGYAEITKYKDYTTRYSNKGLKNPNAKHYELWNDFEAIDVIKASLTDEEYKGYLKGNVLKYKLRDKGQDESDKVKIKDYQNELNNN